tara:strand:+ start:1526 stop:2065 length:540 start_codon:yes stop_codon:yes gene_type:complete
MEAFGKTLKNGEGKTMDEALAGVTYPPCHNITTAERDWWASACRVLYNKNKELADPLNGHATCGGECCEEAIDKIASLKYENQKLKAEKEDLEEQLEDETDDAIMDILDCEHSEILESVKDLQEKYVAEIFEKEEAQRQLAITEKIVKTLKELVEALGVQHTGTGANETQWWHQICKDM